MSEQTFKPETTFWKMQSTQGTIKQIKYICRVKYYISKSNGQHDNAYIFYNPIADELLFSTQPQWNDYIYLEDRGLSIKEMIKRFPKIKKYIDK